MNFIPISTLNHGDIIVAVSTLLYPRQRRASKMYLHEVVVDAALRSRIVKNVYYEKSNTLLYLVGLSVLVGIWSRDLVNCEM